MPLLGQLGLRPPGRRRTGGLQCARLCLRPSQSAVGHEYQSQLSKHCSQVDSVRGFGGKFGVQMDRVDQVRDGGRVGRRVSSKVCA